MPRTTDADMDADTATNDILQRDSDIENLTAAEVRDAFARHAFMRAIIKAHGPRYLRTEECDDIEEMLSETDSAGLKETAIRALGRDHPVAESLGWEDGPGNVETLFDRFTKDDIPEDELVAGAREQLKNALRGCGMPAIAVARRRVREHAERPAQIDREVREFRVRESRRE